MNIPVIILIIVCSFALKMGMAALIRRNRRSRYTVSYKGKLLYKGKPVNLDDHELMISE